MPLSMSQRLSTKVTKMTAVARQEQRAAIRDIGLFVRDRARANAVPGLRGLIRMTPVQETAKTMYVEVGSDSPLVLWHEKGTGIYGPRKQPIVPVRAKVLAWRGASTMGKGVVIVKGRATRPVQSNWIFARSVSGVPAQRMIERAVKDPSTAQYREGRMAEMVRRIGETK